MLKCYKIKCRSSPVVDSMLYPSNTDNYQHLMAKVGKGTQPWPYRAFCLRQVSGLIRVFLLSGRQGFLSAGQPTYSLRAGLIRINQVNFLFLNCAGSRSAVYGLGYVPLPTFPNGNYSIIIILIDKIDFGIVPY